MGGKYEGCRESQHMLEPATKQAAAASGGSKCLRAAAPSGSSGSKWRQQQQQQKRQLAARLVGMPSRAHFITASLRTWCMAQQRH